MCNKHIFILGKIAIEWNYVRKVYKGLDACAGGILFTARFMEACASKSNGRFSAMILGRFGALQGENRFLLGWEKVTKYRRGRALQEGKDRTTSASQRRTSSTTSNPTTSELQAI